MRTVGIKALKNKLSEYVKLAASGELVLVTDRGRVVAELSQPRPHRSLVASEAFLTEGLESGWLKPPAFPLERPPLSRPVAPLDTLLEELAGDRAER